MRPGAGLQVRYLDAQPGGDWFAPVAVAALLSTGALAALLLHREVVFRVLAVLAIGGRRPGWSATPGAAAATRRGPRSLDV